MCNKLLKTISKSIAYNGCVSEVANSLIMMAHHPSCGKYRLVLSDLFSGVSLVWKTRLI